VSILDKIRQVLEARRVLNRLKEARMRGHLKTALLVLAATVSTAIVARVTSACPDLLSEWGTIVTAALGAGATYLVARPKAGAVGKSLLAGLGGAAVAAFLAQLQEVCGADFVKQLPALLTAGAWVGVGLWLKAPHDA
jgi:hypothetical protein